MTGTDDIVTDYEDGACVRIKVIISSTSRNHPIIIDHTHHVLRVRTDKPREKGKANRAVLSLLNDFFGAETRLLSGLTSTQKRIYVALKKSEVIEKLDDFTGVHERC